MCPSFCTQEILTLTHKAFSFNLARFLVGNYVLSLSWVILLDRDKEGPQNFA